MRGTLWNCVGTDSGMRIIPADAGNTPVKAIRTAWKRDHPRGCGEHSYQTLHVFAVAGSSPRMRGTRNSVSRSPIARRIIPADAGNTSCRRWGWSPQKDHPRGCGEHDTQDPAEEAKRGSSPRMRGTHTSGATPHHYRRIIPADAGNTGDVAFGGLCDEDHPRGCGEHPGSACSPGRCRGSSPRMRGTLVLGLGANHHLGIIPADAGNTETHSVPSMRFRDHPRGCGEHISRKATRLFWKGSSPRMRGTRSVAVMAQALQGIIPADAGNTGTRALDKMMLKDHPRGCGEHSRRLLPIPTAPGSSPRMRGTLV